MVFAGGEGWLLLIQPASIDAATSKLASTLIIASFNISTGRLTRLISSWLPFCAPVGGCGSGGSRVRLSSHVLHWVRWGQRSFRQVSLSTVVQHGGWGEGIAFPFSKIDKRERDTLTSTCHATSAEGPFSTRWVHELVRRSRQQKPCLETR